MPNWCNNKITITGDEDKMKILVAKFREIENDDEAFVMEHLLGKDDRPADYEDGGWYDYNCQKFGTKWDFPIKRINALTLDDDLIEIDIDTAWAPPEKFLETLTTMYGVSATILYFEPGMDFSGKTVFSPKGIGWNESGSYAEGLYKYDDNFWDEVDYIADCDVTNDTSFEDFMKSFQYVPKEYHNKLKESYDNAVKRIKS